MADGTVGPLPARPPALRSQVLRRLEELIADGTFQPGQRLPSERALSEQLDVSRGTIREAIQLLAALDMVEIRHGAGTVVRPGADAQTRRRQWTGWTISHTGRIRELLEVRRGLESFAAELAAVRIGPGQLDELDDVLDVTASAAAENDLATLVQADHEFHRTIYRASGNAALVELLDQIASQLAQERATTWDRPGRPQRSLVEHRAIAVAISAGDGEQARDAVVDHLLSIEREVLEISYSARAAEAPTPNE